MPVSESSIYRRIRLLGEGSFGKAYLVEQTSDGELLVVKQMDLRFMSEEEKKDAQREARILAQLKHPNIINFREVYKTKKGKLCIVMDYADGGDLAQRLKSQQGQPFLESQILDWFTQLCLAVKHIHDRKILHRDIKSQNIFLTKDGRVRLGDFGIAKVLNHTREKLRTIVGTPYYLAPELIENKPYSFSGDMWSLGVVLYELCSLKPPFDADNLPMLALKIVDGNFQPIPNEYSRELKSLVGQLLTVNEKARPNVYQVLKMPIITNRIKNFLSETFRSKEFSHTILHNHQILTNGLPMKFIEDVKTQVRQNGTPKKSYEQLPKKSSNLPVLPDIQRKDPPQSQPPQPPIIKQPRISTPLSGNGYKRKNSGDEKDKDAKNPVKLPEIKHNIQSHQIIKEFDAKPPITRQASRATKISDVKLKIIFIQPKPMVPQTPNERVRVKISDIASKKPQVVQRCFTKDSQEESDHPPQVRQQSLFKFEESPKQQNYFNDKKAIPKSEQRGFSAAQQKPKLIKSPSVYDALAKQPSERFAKIKEQVLSKGGRFVISDGEKDSAPQPPPKNKIRIHLGHKQMEQLFKRNHTHHESEGSVEKDEVKEEINATLQKISEISSDKKSPSKLSISIPIEETIKSGYILSVRNNTVEDVVDEADFNFSLTKSQLVGQQTVKKLEKRKSVEDKPTLVEDVRTFDEKTDQRKRKIIFKDPFSKLAPAPMVKSIRRVDSEEELKLMVQELQGLVVRSNEQKEHQEIVPMEVAHNSSSSLDDNSAEFETPSESRQVKIEDENVYQTLDYICGNKEIKHLQAQLISKLGKHYQQIYTSARERANCEDLGKSIVAAKIRELITCEPSKVEEIATLMITLVVLAKGEALSSH